MRKLLSANFCRLKKDRVFWLGMTVMLLISVWIIVNQYRDSIQYPDQPPMIENVFFGYALLVGAAASVFCSLFTGTEYSDGAIRNKLVVGHTRTAIYLSNLIVNTAAALLMCAAFLLPACALGIPLLGVFTAGGWTVALFLLASVLLVAAFSAIFTCVAMSCQNRAVAAVICILGFFILFFAATYLNARLTAPEFYDGYVFTDSLGNMQTDRTPNPEYLRGTARQVYTFLYDFLPTGQALQISNMSATHLWQMPLYSLLITLAATVGGALVFSKKDLK